MPYNPQRRSAGINKGKRKPLKACDETWSTRASTTTPPKRRQNDLVMHQMMSCPREVGDRTINQFGADFRYAVEFSKYGRAPLEVSRPPPGQPDLRYRLGSTTPNRLCPAVPDSRRRRVRRRLRCRGVEHRGVPWAVHLPGPSGPAAVRFPLGHGESYGAVARSSNLQVRSGLSDHWTESVQVSDPAFGAAKDVPGGRDAVHSRHLASGRGQDVTTVGPSGHPVKR